MEGTVLIIDDEAQLTHHLSTLLEREGYRCKIAHSAEEARPLMEEFYPDIVLLDLNLPDIRGDDLMMEFKPNFPDTQFIIITAYGSIRSAVRNTRKGASDYLTKPFEMEELLLSIKSAMRAQALGEEVRSLRSQISPSKKIRSSFSSPAMARVKALAEVAATQQSIVLLLGESGTGKDYMAQWIHQRSSNKEGPFFSINCAALPRELAESELFGHRHGAFTGAKGRKRGMLELAQNGTLLLNEIGELDLLIQSKLLTFLDTKSFLRVGGEKSVEVNTRLIAATNRDLKEEVKAGRFREDLFYRLNVLPIELPSLRERQEDLPAIVDSLLEQLKTDLGRSEKPILEDRAWNSLNQYQWPGNIRELRNILERAILLSPTNIVSSVSLDLPSHDSYDEWKMEVTFPHNETLHDVTKKVARSLIQEALHRSKTKQEAAKILGISRHALTHQIKSLNLDIKSA